MKMSKYYDLISGADVVEVLNVKGEVHGIGAQIGLVGLILIPTASDDALAVRSGV